MCETHQTITTLSQMLLAIEVQLLPEKMISKQRTILP